VLSGDDGTAARSIQAGIDGLISVGSNVLPGAYRRMCELAAAHDHEATESWDARLQPFHDFCGVEPNPIPVKALLRRIGIGHDLRLPLLPLSAAHHPAPTILPATSPPSKPFPATDLRLGLTQEIHMRQSVSTVRVLSYALLAVAVAAGTTGCFKRGVKGDYALAPEMRPLEVPPDLNLPNHR
jgi:hypothetical protein